MFGHDNEPVTLHRDVNAVMIPAGVEVKLREGMSGFITQALGGSFTVYVEGNLFRVAGVDADALRVIATGGARRIIYVSCDPATLARDVAGLEEHYVQLQLACRQQLREFKKP